MFGNKPKPKERQQRSPPSMGNPLYGLRERIPPPPAQLADSDNDDEAGSDDAGWSS